MVFLWKKKEKHVEKKKKKNTIWKISLKKYLKHNLAIMHGSNNLTNPVYSGILLSNL